MKSRAELKQEAKEVLRGRWGTAIAIMLLYFIVSIGITLIASFIPVVGGVASLVISIPLAFGFVGQMIKFSRNEEFGYFDFFTIGFNNFVKSWGIYGHTLLKLLGWILACVGCYIIGAVVIVGTAIVSLEAVTGNVDIDNLVTAGGAMLIIAALAFLAFFVFYVVLMVKSYYYVLTQYIGNDNLDMTAKDVVEKSKELMTGNRWRFFVLGLSFIGWAILASITCGIGYIWLAPYMEITTIKFYEDLIGDSKKNSNDEILNNNTNIL